MKLATKRNGSRDGALCVVSRDLAWVLDATDIATTMQIAVERWEEVRGALEERYAALNGGEAAGAFAFEPGEFMAPLPRAYQWIDAGGYMTHMKRMRAARGVPMPDRWDVEPTMYQGLSDCNLAGTDDLVGDPDWGIDFETEIAIVVGDVPIQTSRGDASDVIRLLILLNDVSLRKLIPTELAKGFGFLRSKPACFFAPVAITPDELGPSWKDTKAICRIRNEINGELIGEPRSGVDQQFGFGTIIEYATMTRSLIAGTLVGSGTISNEDSAAGFSCLVEKYVAQGSPPQFLKPGDRLRIEAFDEGGGSLFGAIDQQVRLAPWLHGPQP